MDKPIYVVNSKVADSLRELCGGSLPEGYIVSDELPKLPEYKMKGSNPTIPPEICRPDPPATPPRLRYAHNFVPAPGEVEFAVCSKCGIVVGAAPKSREHFERERNLIEKGCQFK